MYVPNKPLWAPQEEALARMEGREIFALLMAMRTGKSATILADFGKLELAGKAKDLCIIAPAGVYKTWTTAIEEHLSEDLRSRMDVYVWESRTGSSSRALDFLGILNGPRCLLINVEALSMATSPARDVVEYFLSQRKSYVAIDESTVIKNPSAKRTKYIIKTLRPLAKYRRILSGLPTPRSPLDLFSQFQFLDWRILNHKSFYGFQEEHAVMIPQQYGGRKFNMVVGFKKGTDEKLATLIKPHSYRVQFRPKVPSTYSIREVAMTPEQERAYSEMKKFSTTQLKNLSHVTAQAVIAQITKMHQILCGHVRDEAGLEQSIPENRTSALLQELEDYAGKAVIWFTYVRNLEQCHAAIEEQYGKGSAARFYGGNAGDREDDEKRFKGDPECRFMLATAGAGGRGRTWSVADRVIYFSSSDNLEHRDQSEQRAHGVEKDQGVDYVDLVVPGTVDEKILKALRAKINMASAINGDNYKEWLI